MSDDLTDLRARIKAIHKQDTFLDVPCCSTCRDPDWPAERPAMWPCPTIRAVLAGPADTDSSDVLARMITVHDAGMSVAAAYQRGLEDGRDRCRRVHLVPVDEAEDDWSPDPGSADTDSRAGAHGRACAYFPHEHGPRCHSHCPTCHAVSGQVDEPRDDRSTR